VQDQYVNDGENSFSLLYILEEALDLQRNNPAIKNLLLQYLTIHNRESILELARIPDKVYFIKFMSRFACSKSFKEVPDLYRFLLSLNIFYDEIDVEVADYEVNGVIGYGFFQGCLKGKEPITMLPIVSDSMILEWQIEYLNSDSIQQAYNGIDHKYLLYKLNQFYFNSTE
jgi:hypothetical protein